MSAHKHTRTTIFLTTPDMRSGWFHHARAWTLEIIFIYHGFSTPPKTKQQQHRHLHRMPTSFPNADQTLSKTNTLTKTHTQELFLDELSVMWKDFSCSVCVCVFLCFVTVPPLATLWHVFIFNMRVSVRTQARDPFSMRSERCKRAPPNACVHKARARVRPHAYHTHGAQGACVVLCPGGCCACACVFCAFVMTMMMMLVVLEVVVSAADSCAPTSACQTVHKWCRAHVVMLHSFMWNEQIESIMRAEWRSVECNECNVCSSHCDCELLCAAGARMKYAKHSHVTRPIISNHPHIRQHNRPQYI